MKIILSKAALQAELASLKAIVVKNTAMPILEHILLESIGNNQLRLTASTLHTTLTSELGAELVEVAPGEDGKLAAPAQRFYDVVRLMPDGRLQLEPDARSYVTASTPPPPGRKKSGSRFRMPAMDPSAWPPRPDAGLADWTEIPASTLKGVLRGVDYAVAPESDSRYSLKGIKLEIEGTTVRAVATDGHRMAMAEHALDAFTMADASVLIPEHGTKDLGKLLADHSGGVMCAVAGNHVFFRVGRRQLSVSLLVGQFPDYNIVLGNAARATFANFKTDELEGALRRTLLAADDKSKAVKFAFTSQEAGGDVNLKAQTQESGEAEETLVSDWNGGGSKVWLNAQYVLDFLGSVNSGSVRWHMGGSREKLFLVGEKDKLTVRYALMPLDIPEAEDNSAASAVPSYVQPA